MINIKETTRKYRSLIKYGLFGILLFLMIGSIKIYMNYYNIIFSIEQTKYQIADEQQKNEFTKFFVIPYLKSNEAQKFLAHENNLLLTGEYVVMFTKDSQNSLQSGHQYTGGNDNSKIIKNPQDSWNYFISDKIKKNAGD